jgi:hypothetical protein
MPEFARSSPRMWWLNRPGGLRRAGPLDRTSSRPSGGLPPMASESRIIVGGNGSATVGVHPVDPHGIAVIRLSPGAIELARIVDHPHAWDYAGTTGLRGSRSRAVRHALDNRATADPDRSPAVKGPLFVVFELVLSEHRGGNVHHLGTGSTSEPPMVRIPARLTPPHAPPARARRSVLSHQLLCAQPTIVEVHRKPNVRQGAYLLREPSKTGGGGPIRVLDAARNPTTTR